MLSPMWSDANGLEGWEDNDAGLFSFPEDMIAAPSNSSACFTDDSWWEWSIQQDSTAASKTIGMSGIMRSSKELKAGDQKSNAAIEYEKNRPPATAEDSQLKLVSKKPHIPRS